MTTPRYRSDDAPPARYSRREFLAESGAAVAGATIVAPALVPMDAAAKAKPPEGELRVLPPPSKEGGLPLQQAFAQRHSSRAFSARKLPETVLSDLLWSAYGVNRAGGDRTAPSWRHLIVIDVYAAMEDGLWLYDPKRHALVPHPAGDIRALTGQQDFPAAAPLNLVYVANGQQLSALTPENRKLVCSVDSAFIGQNVYLFCASAGLATVFRGSIDYRHLERAMKLDDNQFVTFAQTVGYPKGA